MKKERMSHDSAANLSLNCYCHHLGDNESDINDIQRFTIARKEGQGLLNYLYVSAFKEEKLGVARTYLVRDNNTDEIVGFFSLRASMVTINERKNARGNTAFDTLSAVELSNFAANDAYKKKYPNLSHIGEHIFTRFILPTAYEAAKHIGVCMLTIFALPYEELIKYYERLGFFRLPEKYETELSNRIKPAYDDSCIFMYQKI